MCCGITSSSKPALLVHSFRDLDHFFQLRFEEGNGLRRTEKPGRHVLYELPAAVSLLHPLLPEGMVYCSPGRKRILKRYAGRLPNPDGRRASNGERPTRTSTRVLPPTNLRSARWSALPSTLTNRITDPTVYHPTRNDRIDQVLWLEIPRLLFTA